MPLGTKNLFEPSGNKGGLLSPSGPIPLIPERFLCRRLSASE